MAATVMKADVSDAVSDKTVASKSEAVSGGAGEAEEKKSDEP